jgi:hypothetical protein
MTPAHQVSSVSVAENKPAAIRPAWLFSWPLLMGLFAYLYFVSHGPTLLRDGDTYWHIAAGRWIFQNGTVPSHDPFSHTMRGAAWTAHEWLSELVLAAAHQVGGWTLVVAITALALAATIGLLTRALLKWLEPIYALMFSALALCMAGGHVLARPHVLAMPLLMIWTIELVHASESSRAPKLWLLPVMTLWANMHGGFTLGIALAFAFALEALLAGRREQRLATAARSWGIFLILAMASSLVTPHGSQGILFTWQVLFEDSYALERIREWQSPDFHNFQPLEFWLLGGLALVLHQGLRLPPVRLLLILGLLHLSLKHMRSIELVGLLTPLVLAAPFAAQWRQRRQNKAQLESVDRFFRSLAQPAGRGAILVGLMIVVAMPPLIASTRPLQLPASVAPVLALQAVRQANITGPVLNSYGSGGYLIFSGIPAFIDGRSDMYREDFMKQYGDAIELRTSDALEKVLGKYQITWTLLDPGIPAVALLDHLPGWSRIHADEAAVVHARDVR